MNLKLRALSVSIAACTALSAFGAVNAFAETGGHFTSDSSTGNTWIKGTESVSGGHVTEVTVPGLTGIICDQAAYSGTASGATVTQLDLTPTYTNCHTTASSVTSSVSVDMAGCLYRFTIGKKSTADNTVDLVCAGPTSKFIDITHPECDIRIPEQSGIVGVAYNTVVENSKHAITLGVTLRGFTAHFESGFCVLLGTKQTAELAGSVTIQGFEDTGPGVGTQVNITATGSEG